MLPENHGHVAIGLPPDGRKKIICPLYTQYESLFIYGRKLKYKPCTGKLQKNHFTAVCRFPVRQLFTVIKPVSAD